MCSAEYVPYIAVERWRNVMWTLNSCFRALIFVGIGALILKYGATEVSPHNYYGFVALCYLLTGIASVLLGMLLDARDTAQRPQAIEVLLRHDGKAWLLNVMRTPTGELFAPMDERLRTMRPVSMNELSEDVLGCPRFTWDFGSIHYRVLGKTYFPTARH